MAVFTNRYRRALRDKRLTVETIPSRARTRAWMAMDQFSESWQEWNDWTSHLDQTYDLLSREYGSPKLIAYIDDRNNRGAVNLDTFVQRCYPSQFLDVIEAHYAQLNEEMSHGFQAEVNRILREESVPWRMSGGEVFKIESQFLDVEIVERTEELLAAKNYSGALDEFREARRDVTAGDTRDAVAKAHSAMESAMKTVLGVSNGSASELIRQLGQKGFFDDLPEDCRKAFGEQVLMSLPTLGNRLGRHGQGAEVVDVPRHYAELALHLAAAFIRVLVERQQELTATISASTPQPEPVVPASNEDIPF